MQQQERLVFSPSVEALLIRGVGDRLTPQLKRELVKLGFDIDQPLLPAYSATAWQKAVDLIATELYPDVSMPQAQRSLGESTVHGFERTTLGKAMVAVSKLIGSRRALMRFAGSSRSSNNYSRMEARELSPNEIEFLCMPYDGWPEFVAGCLTALVEMTGGKSPKSTIVSHDRDTERLVLRISWA